MVDTEATQALRYAWDPPVPIFCFKQAVHLGKLARYAKMLYQGGGLVDPSALVAPAAFHCGATVASCSALVAGSP